MTTFYVVEVDDGADEFERSHPGAVVVEPVSIWTTYVDGETDWVLKPESKSRHLFERVS